MKGPHETVRRWANAPDEANPREQPHRAGLEGVGNRRLYGGGGWADERGVDIVRLGDTVGSRRFAPGPKGYARSDERILEDVFDTLHAATELDTSDVEVRVEGGEVRLSGTAPDTSTKHELERLSAGIRGVRDVVNHLRRRRREE